VKKNIQNVATFEILQADKRNINLHECSFPPSILVHYGNVAHAEFDNNNSLMNPNPAPKKRVTITCLTFS